MVLVVGITPIPSLQLYTTSTGTLKYLLSSNTCSTAADDSIVLHVPARFYCHGTIAVLVSTTTALVS